MKDENDIKISKTIDSKRLQDLMDAGRGKYKNRLQIKLKYKESDPTFDPERVWNKMKDGTKWKNTELATVTGIDRQTIGNMRKGKYNDGLKRGSTSDTIEKIAEALDVDPEYLTGEQSGKRKRKRKISPEDEQILKDKMEKGRQLMILSDFLKIYGLHLQYDREFKPEQYSFYDEDGRLIREDRPVEELDVLVGVIMDHLRTGCDLIGLFFDEEIQMNYF